MPKERFKIIPAVYLCLIRDKKILLLRRHNTGYQDGNYSLIAGHLDGNESLTQAMAREAKEEAGIIVKAEDLELIHVINRKSDDWERVDFFFKTNNWIGEPKIQETEKCDDLSWFPLDNLPTNMTTEVKQSLKHIVRKSPYSELNWD